jgi:glyoxylase-like metal-dependent hydrolase (beta-lactamase superfamily II)
VNAVLRFEVLETCRVRKDAGAMFGTLPRSQWESMLNVSQPESALPRLTITRNHELQLAANSVLIWWGTEIILIDAGGYQDLLANEWRDGLGFNRLHRRLQECGVQPRDITRVIFTSSEKDHTGGAVRQGREGQPIPCFPNAVHYVSKFDIPAIVPLPVADGHDDLAALERLGLLATVGYERLLPVIEAFPMEAYPGRAMVLLLHAGGELVVVGGDLLPHSNLLAPGILSTYYMDRQLGYAQKLEWLEFLESSGACLVLSHGQDLKEVYLYRDHSTGQAHLRGR